jgi:hypothetical protein
MRREIVSGRVQKFNGTQVLVCVKWNDDGEPLLDIREHFQRDGVWEPMRNGVTLGMSKARLIADAIERAVMIAEGKHASTS